MATVRTLADIEELERRPLAPPATDRSVYELLARSAVTHADSVALSFLPSGRPEEPTHDLTYASLFAAVSRVARLYRAVGLKEGDAVAILLPDVPQALIALLAAEVAAIAMPLNPHLEPEILATLVRAARARCLVVAGRATSPELWDKAVAVCGLVPSIEMLVTLGEPPDERPGGVELVPLARADSLEGGRVPWADDLTPDHTAAYFHTGGTTAAPKLARHSHRNQLYMAGAIADVLDYRATDCELVGLPLYHVNAAIGSALVVFATGGRVVLLGPKGFRHREIIQGFWRVVERFRATFFSGVPTLYAALLDVPVGDSDLSSLRFGMCGAAPMPVEVFRRFEQVTGVSIVEGYGLTEGTLVSTINPVYGEKRVGSVGLRFPRQRVEVVEVDAGRRIVRRCAAGEVGRVVLSGPNVFPGYLDPAHDQLAWLGDGVLDTGDLGRIDADGYLWLSGRTKDVIIRGGHNIDPEMVEEALCRHPAVRLAAAVGKPHPYSGEVVQAFVQLAPGASATQDELLEFARRNVPERAAIPTSVRILPELPLTAVGKISKAHLRVLSTEEAVAERLAERPEVARAVTVSVALGPSGVEVSLAPRAGSAGAAEVEQARGLLDLLPVTIL